MKEGRRILVIGGDQELNQALSPALRPFAQMIEWVETCEEAQDLLTGGSHYDLVICTHPTPKGMAGLDLWIHWKKLNFEVPFLLVSEQAAEIFSRLLETGEDAPPLLSKPFSQAQAKKVVQSLLGDYSHGIAS